MDVIVSIIGMYLFIAKTYVWYIGLTGPCLLVLLVQGALFWQGCSHSDVMFLCRSMPSGRRRSLGILSCECRRFLLTKITPQYLPSPNIGVVYRDSLVGYWSGGTWCDVSEPRCTPEFSQSVLASSYISTRFSSLQAATDPGQSRQVGCKQV